MKKKTFILIILFTLFLKKNGVDFLTTEFGIKIH